jgi:predicted molibdopterin-dependent oxidoreductase YjgC
VTSGRTIYHFHTRTKTGRALPLRQAAPGPWVELSVHDAERLGIAEGDLVRVESPRGAVEAAARVGRGRDGVLFIPFHYGYWDTPAGHTPDRQPRAANELTITEWDPVSKQPLHKIAAARVTKLADGDRPAPAPTTTASAPADPETAAPTVGDRDTLVDQRVTAAEPPAPPPTPSHTPGVPVRPTVSMGS